MGNTPSCPVCGETFPDEDYCPRDGIALACETTDAMAEQFGGEVASWTADADRDGKLAGFMQRMSLRRVADQAEPSSDHSGTPLPEELQEQGWRVSGALHSDAAVDRWRIEQSLEGENPRAGHFHRYRTPALTTDAVYRRLAAEPAPQLVRVLAHGTVDFGGARADYELVSHLEPCVALDRWLADSAPSETRALRLLPALVQLLCRLSEHGVRPLTLEPAVLARDSDNLLWLTRAAALVNTVAASEFHAEYARAPLLPQGWTAPELTQDNMLSANAAVFAVGQVLAQAVWGQPCSLSALQAGAVPFRQVSDCRLARVLMGCLWPRPQGRWSVDDLEHAAACTNVETMPAIPAWESLLPGTGSTAFCFAGTSYWRLEDLLDAAAEPANWAEAAQRVEEMLAWAEDTAWAGQVELMRRALAQHRSADWVLVALRRVVRPDAPLSWRGLDLSDEQVARSMAGLAQRALSEGDKADVATMQALFEADLRGAFTPSPGNS